MTSGVEPGIRRFAAMALAMMALLLPSACARKTPAPNIQAVQTSPEALRTYNFLVYLDNHACFQKFSRTRLSSDPARGVAAMCQKSAAQALDAILDQDPSPYLYLQKADLYWNKNQIHLARTVLQEGLGRFPENKGLNFSLANTYLMEDRLSDAVDILDEYLKRAPDDLGARKRLADILVEEKAYAKALDVLAPIPDKERDAETLYLAARAEARLGNVPQALKDMKRAVEKDEHFIEAWAELAFLHEQNKDYEAAQHIYARLLEEGDPKFEVRLRLMTLSLKLNNPDKALELALDGPEDDLFLLESARIFLDQGFYAQASAVLDVVESRDMAPEEVSFYRAAVAYEGENDPARALVLLEDISPNSLLYYKALHFRAHLLAGQGESDKAMELIEEAKQRYDNQRDFLRLEASILQDRGEDQAALEILQSLVADDPGDQETLFQLGMLYEQLKDRDKAVETMERIIALDPSNADALNYVGYTLAEQGKDLDRAMVLVKNALKQKPGNGYIVDSLAWVYFRKGELNKAWEEIRRAVANVETDPTIWEHYGDIAKALGKKRSAKKGWKKALELDSPRKDEVREKLDGLK